MWYDIYMRNQKGIFARAYEGLRNRLGEKAPTAYLLY
jgi:hypothetical protein